MLSRLKATQKPHLILGIGIGAIFHPCQPALGATTIHYLIHYKLCIQHIWHSALRSRRPENSSIKSAESICILKTSNEKIESINNFIQNTIKKWRKDHIIRNARARERYQEKGKKGQKNAHVYNNLFHSWFLSAYNRCLPSVSLSLPRFVLAPFRLGKNQQHHGVL